MTKLDCYILSDSSERHSHEHAQIFLPLNDKLELYCNGSTHSISTNELAFIPPSIEHLCLCKNRVLIINIPPDMIKKEDMQSLTNQVVFPVKGPLVNLIELIKDEISHGPTGNTIRYLFYYLYDKLVEYHRPDSLRYIREHYDENISVSQLAKLENYNLSYYNEWFKHQTGVSPGQYIRKVRMEKAKELLLTTQYTMLEIALQVGYQNPAAFTRAFAQTVGQPPVSYRKEQQNLI